MADPLIVTVPPGQRLVVDMDNHQLLIVHGDAITFHLEDLQTNEVRELVPGSLLENIPVPDPETIMAENEILKNLPWQEGPVPFYTGGIGLPPVTDERTEERREAAKKNPTLFYGAGLQSLDSILAAAVVPGPTPAEEIIRSSSTPPAAPAPAPRPTGFVVSSSFEGGREPAQAPAPPPAPGSAMDKAPRDGTFVMLNNGAEEVAARWSSSFGRQFWVDESGDSLGFDADFSSWRTPSAAEREEYGI